MGSGGDQGLELEGASAGGGWGSGLVDWGEALGATLRDRFRTSCWELAYRPRRWASISAEAAEQSATPTSNVSRLLLSILDAAEPKLETRPPLATVAAHCLTREVPEE